VKNDEAKGERSAPAAGQLPGEDDQWLVRVAELASHDAGGVSEEFLGDYLPMLAAAAASGQFPDRAQIDAVRLQGRRAAERSVSVGRGVDLYLSAARRVWAELPAVVRQRDRNAVRAAASAVLQVVDDAVASFAEGHAEAGREMIRREETLRRELIDDLLRGDAHLSELVGRAEPFGLDLTRAHQVALAQPGKRIPSIAASSTALERVVLDRFGDRDVLVATKEGMVVVLALAEATGASGASLATTGDLGKVIHGELSRLRHGSPWRVAVGRAHPGAYGIARSYEEAREGLTMAARMHVERPIVETRDLLAYRVLARDQSALVDLIYSVLNPLRGEGWSGSARGDACRVLRVRWCRYDGCVQAPFVGACRHLSTRPCEVPERVRSVRPSTSLHPAGRGARREATRVARASPSRGGHLPLAPGGDASTRRRAGWEPRFAGKAP